MTRIVFLIRVMSPNYCNLRDSAITTVAQIERVVNYNFILGDKCILGQAPGKKWDCGGRGI